MQPLYGNLAQERAVPEPSNFRYENYNATIDWNVGAFKVLSATSYGVLDADTVTDGTPVYGGVAGIFGGNASPLNGDTRLEKFTQEVRLTSPSSDQLEWQLGGFFTHEDGSLVQNLYAVTAPVGPVLDVMIQPVIDSTYKEGAGFADLTYHFNSQVRPPGRRPLVQQSTELHPGHYLRPPAGIAPRRCSKSADYKRQFE